MEGISPDFETFFRVSLEAFVSFIKSDPVLADSIVSKDWLRFARKYNGAKQVGYDGRMSDNYDVIKNAQ
jgi:hypothetical protein